MIDAKSSILKRAYPTFYQELHKELELIEGVLKKNDSKLAKDVDWQLLANSAHKIKGSAGFFNFEALAIASRDLEKAFSEIPTKVAQSDLDTTVDELFARLKEEVAKLPSIDKYLSA
ncbi:MAG TPA: Hpt domain-containing protein [Oligoflexia bacterium]|nr:Hpt domain-containing protein [Oligoflexia bacterium]HMP26970.1 Hpt domain-containing protein [Oligoflexia bacterium]